MSAYLAGIEAIVRLVSNGGPQTHDGTIGSKREFHSVNEAVNAIVKMQQMRAKEARGDEARLVSMMVGEIENAFAREFPVLNAALAKNGRLLNSKIVELYRLSLKAISEIDAGKTAFYTVADILTAIYDRPYCAFIRNGFQGQKAAVICPEENRTEVERKVDIAVLNSYPIRIEEDGKASLGYVDVSGFGEDVSLGVRLAEKVKEDFGEDAIYLGDWELYNE